MPISSFMHDFELKITLMYLILDLGAAPQFILLE